MQAAKAKNMALTTNHHEQKNNSTWLVIGVVIFLLSRICILFLYSPYVTDVLLYLDLASKAHSGLKAYKDFSYPYMPLSLWMVYLPVWLTSKAFNNFETYRAIFTKELFLIEISMVAILLYTLKSFCKFDYKQLFMVLFCLSIFGLLQGHIIYDRLDVGISLIVVLIWFVSLKTQNTKYGWLTIAMLSNIGILFKFIPALPAVFLATIQNHEQKRLSLVSKLALFVLPAILLIYALDKTIYPGIIHDFASHGERGIQLESLFATPYMLAKIWTNSPNILLATNFGAQHLQGAAISPLIIFISKTLGISLLFSLGFWLLITKSKFKPSTELLLLTPLVILMLFLSTQRVLSTQFFVWIMPWLAIVLAKFPQKNSWLILAFSLYLLTYLSFDIDYWQLVNFNPWSVYAVASRNIVLLTLTIMISKKWLEELMNKNYR